MRWYSLPAASRISGLFTRPALRRIRFINLLYPVFGAKAITVKRDFFGSRYGSEIDDALANVIEKQPVFIFLDEFGGSNIDEGILLSHTGKTRQSARRAHGRTIEGEVLAMVVVATVEPPTIASNTGIRRRTAVLGTLEKIPGERTCDPSQDVIDAVLTLGIQNAGKALNRIEEKTSVAPEGDSSKKEELMEKLDPVGHWPDALASEYEGTTRSDLAAQATEDLKDEIDKPVSLKLISKRVRVSAKWRRF